MIDNYESMKIIKKDRNQTEIQDQFYPFLSWNVLPGGKTVTASRNLSIPAKSASRFLALYGTSLKISSDMTVAMARPISRYRCKFVLSSLWKRKK